MKSIQLPTIFNVATHFVDRHLREGRDHRIAFECGDERVTYRQLYERVNRAGNALKKLGVRQEERVGLLLLDTPEFAYCFFGGIKISAVPIPINTLLKPPEYEYILNDSRARVLIVSESLLPQVQAIAKEKLRYLKTIVVFGNAPDGTNSLQRLLDGSSPELEAEPTTKDDAAFWLYSSGSTGFPKGCVHLHHDMVVCAELYAKNILQIAENDRFFSVAKMFFAYGLGNGLYFALSVGATSILWPGSPSPPNIFSVIEKHRPTLFFSVPSNYCSLLSYQREGGPDFDLSTVRYAVSAGEALAAAIFHRFKARDRAGRSCPAMKRESWMKRAVTFPMARSAACSSKAILFAPVTGTSTKRPKRRSRDTGSAPATNITAIPMATIGMWAATMT